MDLKKKLESIEAAFNELEKKKNEHKLQIEEMEKEQYRLQGEHRIVSSIIEELTSDESEVEKETN